MNRDPILFRVDGTTRTGWQHLARCLTYAAALQRRRRPTYFLSQIEPAALKLIIKRGGSEWLDADHPAGTADDVTETVQEVRRLNAAAVVVDTPSVTEGYLNELASTGTLVMSFDHRGEIRFPSAIVVNPLLAPGVDDYEFQPGTQLLLGARYALVRSEVRRVRPLRAQEPPQPFRALVALGDDDPNHESGELAKLLLNCPKVGKVDIIVRNFHPDLEALQALANESSERLSVSTEPAEIAARLARAHFAVSAGNSWSLELACIGVPQMIIVQDEAHWSTAQRLEEEGAAQCLGWHENTTAGTLRTAVANLLGDAMDRQAMARCGRQLIDGRGNDRLVTALEVMLHPSRQLDVDYGAAA
jgi:spore coat polysaccharide biosynthesis predicted glycosyltransferase SpsG